MLKQAGITTVELLMGLVITSSATYVTLDIAEKAEQSVREYQELTDVNHAIKIIKQGGHRINPAKTENNGKQL